MSVENADNDDSSTEQEYEVSEKEATVFAYSSGDFEDEHAFLDSVFGDAVDFDVTETEETEDLEVKITLDDDLPGRISPYADSDKRELIEFFDDEDTEVPDYLNVETDRETIESHVHDAKDVIRGAIGDVVTEADLEGFGYTEPWLTSSLVVSLSRHVEDNVGNSHEECVKVEVAHGSVDQRKELAPKDEREPGDMYDGDDEFWSIQLTAQIEASDCDENFMVTEKTLGPIEDALLEFDGVDSVRREACVTNKKERGNCDAIQ